MIQIICIGEFLPVKCTVVSSYVQCTYVFCNGIYVKCVVRRTYKDYVQTQTNIRIVTLYNKMPTATREKYTNRYFIHFLLLCFALYNCRIFILFLQILCVYGRNIYGFKVFSIDLFIKTRTIIFHKSEFTLFNKG